MAIEIEEQERVMKCQFCDEDVAPFDISHACRLQDALSRRQIERTNKLQQIVSNKMEKIDLKGRRFRWHYIAGEWILADQDGAVGSRVSRDGELWAASVEWEEATVLFLSCDQAKAGVQRYVEAHAGLMGVETVEPSESIDDLEISARPYNALTKEGITTVAKLVKLSESDLLRVPNMGRLGINEIKASLAGRGLRLKDND